MSQVDITPRGARAPGSRADGAMRRLLFVPGGAPVARDQSAHRMFSLGIALSALRCLLSYVVFPILTPVIGVATGVAPVIGIPIAVLALVFDVVGIRRFWLANHRWRWGMTVIYATVMGMVGALLVADIVHLVS